jgi:integrase
MASKRLVERKTLNDRMLNGLKAAPAGKRYVRMDALVPGFGVRVTDTGQKTFILVGRFGGAQHPTRRAIGEYGAVTLDKARETARAWIEMNRKGIDPRAHEEQQRITQQRRQANSFRAVAEDFIRLAVVGPNREKPKQRKGLEVERDLRREFIHRWGGRPITEINSHDVIAVLDEVVSRGATYQAHNLLGHIRRLFNWAIARGVYGLERSPCDRMKPRDVIGAKAVRSRVLTDPELLAFWRATEKIGYPYGPLFRLLALTIQRKSEVAEAAWPELDLKKALWTIPAERMKSDAPHIVPLTEDAIAILKSLPEFKSGDFVFSTCFGKSAVNGFSKAKNRLDGLMLSELRAAAEAGGEDPGKVKLRPFTIQDIRRTGRTGLSALPVPDMVRELVIAHAKPGLHRVYDQHAYVDEKRRALELWAARLRSIVEPGRANVVRLADARA